MTTLDRTDRAIVNAFQGGFPVVERPFEPAADALSEHGVDVEPTELARRIRALVECNTLSRFGPIINANALGGATTLVAASVPEDRFDATAETVNDYREVAHNYERNHRLNMWFVLSVVEATRISDVLDSIERETGIDTYNLPKQTEFALGATFSVDGPLAETGFDLSHLGPTCSERAGESLSSRQRELLTAVQGGFPLTTTPYGAVADELGVSTDWVLRMVESFLADGTFRRVGAVPNHYALGYTENPMTVWNVPDGHVEEVGRAVGSLSFVTHCYQRPRHEGVWPYNVFAMAHAQSAAEADDCVEQVRDVVETRCGPVDSEILNSTRILKKAGLRLAERTAHTGK